MTILRTLLAGSAAIALMSGTASAADLLTPVPISDVSLFDFEGMYVGATGGLAWTGSGYGTLGIVVGNNFAVTDGIIAGLEFQADGYFGGGGLAGWDMLGLGRVGGFIDDNTMIYGELGAGVVGSSAVYAIGGGVEMALADQLSVRGELQGLGAFGSMPSVGKATAGLIWHLN
ncbi:MAG: hypothetical protein ABL866_13450 [Devosia sp.]